MPTVIKYLAAAAAVLALAVSTALAAGATATHSPARPKLHQMVDITVKGMKPHEAVRGTVTLPFGQVNKYTAPARTNHTGTVIFHQRAQVRGTHRWVFRGLKSHRVARTKYYVR